jgi:hypothetical protein
MIDDLLARADAFTEIPGRVVHATPLVRDLAAALRAVVKRHAPVVSTLTKDHYTYCSACGAQTSWPCADMRLLAKHGVNGDA